MSIKKPPKSFVQRNVALCYVRLSFTRDGDDKNSPDRQRANIQAKCDENGWLPEWHTDTDGHKSGRHETNRPGWLALKARLGDPDVVALVANDLSRLHRKGWRVGDLIDNLEQRDIRLVIAAPGRELDTSTPTGRLFITFSAIFDEWYAEDISQRAKDSADHRKKMGKALGRAPFGAKRRADGYLMPSDEGAWLMPDGSYFAGKETDAPPDPAALWRGYYQCAERILTLFAENADGQEVLAYRMQMEGWPFRDKDGKPRRFGSDDIRRIVSCWPTYGGIVFMTSKKSKDRTPREINLEEVRLNPERAIFPIDLLKRVAYVRRERALKAPNDGVKQKDNIYVLHGLVYCAHCEKLAAERNDPKLRTRMVGSAKYGQMRYRHQPGVVCACTNRMVTADLLEGDFERLIKLMTVDPEQFPSLVDLAKQVYNTRHSGDVDPEVQKRESIALCNRRINAIIQLYKDGRCDEDEYRRVIEQNEREIAYWEAHTTELEKATLELSMCVEALAKLAKLWDNGTPEDKKGMVRTLFTNIVYDLDTKRITDYKLKPWAERFLVLRAALYDAEQGEENKNAPTIQGTVQAVPLSGSFPYPRYSSTEFTVDHTTSERIIKSRKDKRNALIREQHAIGKTLSEIASTFEISVQRVWEIVKMK